MSATVLVAGGTGDLGQRIIRELVERDARVRVLSRPGGHAARAASAGLERVDVVEADYGDRDALIAAVAGVDAVVSAVSGTRSVIVDVQRSLLAATVAAGVARFVPSDYSADFRRIAPGSNRNLELHREFSTDVDAAPVRATSVLNGMFTELLTDAAPLILFDRRRVLFWSSPDRVLDFTTKDDTARTVAQVALDAVAPRVVEVAGDRVTARQIAATLSELTGTPFRLLWAGTTGTLGIMASVTRRLSRTQDDTFPAWQGMQYFVSMFSEQARLQHVDNDRYGAAHWTTVRELLAAHLARPEGD